MRIPRNLRRQSLSRLIVCSVLLFSALPAVAQEVYLCVWRNPERTMRRIFADAVDYKTVNMQITEKQRAAIEERLGFELLPGQREIFPCFEMTGEDGRRLGLVIAASQKGEYGAIEFVFGLDMNNRIKGIYIQRSRERDRTFKEREFLDLFVGKSADDPEFFTRIYEGKPTPGTDAVIRGIRKELVTLQEQKKGDGLTLEP